MSTAFGWCIDGKHRLPGDNKITAAMNEGKCPGKSYNSNLTCGCWCHHTTTGGDNHE